MERLRDIHVLASVIHIDNGSELTSMAFTGRCADCHIKNAFIGTGKSNQSALFERVNRTCCNEVLETDQFADLNSKRGQRRMAYPPVKFRLGIGKQKTPVMLCLIAWKAHVASPIYEARTSKTDHLRVQNGVLQPNQASPKDHRSVSC